MRCVVRAHGERMVEVGQGQRQARARHVEVRRPRPCAGERPPPHREVLQVGTHTPRVGSDLRHEVEHRCSRVERDRRPSEMGQVQPGAASEVGGDTAVGHECGERRGAIQEPRGPMVAPRTRSHLVGIDGAAIHRRIIAAMHGEVRVVDHVPQAFAALVAEECPRSIALSGGDTARAAYELLAVADVAWGDVDIYFGDERWVPVDDPESNEGMARHTFVDQVDPLAVHSLRRAGSTIEAAASAYSHLIADAPPIELVHLGLGPDGHTASLFPGSAALTETERFVVVAGDDQHPHPRLTFTYPALSRARLVVFTVACAAKRDAFARVRDGDDLPAARVDADRVVWLVDQAAAGTRR